MLGVETVLWQGADPTPVGSGGGVSKLPLSNAPATTRIKIYLDSPAVPGWNEIDAVALVDSTGSRTGPAAPKPAGRTARTAR